MTYQKYYEKLHNDYSNASEIYLKLELELSKTNGFGNFMDIPNYADAKSNWQIATTNYWNFLSDITGKNINPNDEFNLT